MNGVSIGLQVLGAVLALALLAGILAAYFRSGSVKGLRDTNTDLRGERDDWKGRYETEVERRQSLEARVANLESEAQRKDAALVRIGEQAVGTADIRELAAQVETLATLGGHHDTEAERRHKATVNHMQGTTRALVHLRDAIEGRTDPKPPEVPL